jgi:hypothetical protein
MKMRKEDKRQRGVALLLAVFALLLLSAVALAMLFSSDTETTISVNYRDKQGAIYAALAGLQEARDRIQPLTGDLGPGTNLSSLGLNIVPTALPSSGSPNVLYIINPAPGETVAPWSPTINGKPNPYFDDELCHEPYFVSNLGVTAGSPGVRCPAQSSSLPTGSSWYTWYDNSQKQTKAGASGGGSTTDPTSAAYTEANYHLSSPLSYKWVRITLKADNMTPITVGPGTGRQVCWFQNNHHEQPLPAGYNNNCQPPLGGVTNIFVTNNGSGYTSPPAVTISGGTGSGATAVATVGPLGGVTSAALSLPNYGGQGYTSAPAVTVTPVDGLGAGAIVNAILTGTVPVASVGPTPPATTWAPGCYPAGTSPSISFNPPGAAASVAMTGNSCIYSYTVSATPSAGCGARNTTYNVTPSGGTGTATFAGTVTTDNNKKISTSTVWYPSNPGSYSGFPSLVLPSGCSGYTVQPTYGVQVSTVTVTNGGSYQVGAPPSAAFVGGSPVGGAPSATATLSSLFNPTPVASLSIPVGGNGSGYDVDPILTIAPPSCIPGPSCVSATGTASITPSNGVTSVCVSQSCGGNPGTGYTPNFPPTVTIAPPCTPYPACGGTQAQAYAQVGSGATDGYQGPVYLLTALAVTPSGARAMIQMEVGTIYSTYNFGLGGALTLLGPNPGFSTPSSSPYQMIGNDCPTCTTPPSGCNTSNTINRDGIGVYDPTNATNPSAVDTLITELGKPANYIGANQTCYNGVCASVANANLGSPTASDMNAYVAQIAATAGAMQYCNPSPGPSCPNPSTMNLGTPQNWPINVVNGNYTMGPTTGYGILVVTGNLNFSGNYAWNGLILVIGSGGISNLSGGGNGQINGALFVANTSGAPPSGLGSVNVNWNGGGTNTLQYDHCWADYLMSSIPGVPTVSSSPLNVLSLRTEVY